MRPVIGWPCKAARAKTVPGVNLPAIGSCRLGHLLLQDLEHVAIVYGGKPTTQDPEWRRSGRE